MDVEPEQAVVGPVITCMNRQFLKSRLRRKDYCCVAVATATSPSATRELEISSEPTSSFKFSSPENGKIIEESIYSSIEIGMMKTEVKR